MAPPGLASKSFCVVAVMAALSRFMLGPQTDGCTCGKGHSLDVPVATTSPVADIHNINGTWLQLSAPVEAPMQAQAASMSAKRAAQLEAICVQTEWINGLAKPMVPAVIWNALPDILQSWLRNWIFSIFIYFGLGFIWSYYIYQVFGSDLFPTGNVPAWSDMLEQMQVSFVALPLYSMLPAVTEAICKRGWTLAYGSISHVGLPRYLAYLCLYMFFVEFAVYWMHRKLHEIPQGYKYLHAIHHKYNKAHTMSPFAGLAFHAVDGILQALPYTLTLFVVPMHFFTHEVLLFLTAFWTANIHDNLHGNVRPIMGAGWHSIHHTLYKFNYGHYFVFMDWFFGTLLSPEELALQELARKEAAAEKRTSDALVSSQSVTGSTVVRRRDAAQVSAAS